MSVLVGTVVAHTAIVDSTPEPPEGWLLCDGSELSRETYAELFAVIGTLHGGGDGVTTFNLPDYRGRFLRGMDGGVGRDPDANTRDAPKVGGQAKDQVGSVQGWATGIPVGVSFAFLVSPAGQHQHAVPHLPVDSSWYYIAGNHYATWNESSVDSSSSGAHTHVVASGGDAETTPKSIYVHYLIACGTVTP